MKEKELEAGELEGVTGGSGYCTVERIEGNIVICVCEDGRTVALDRRKLPGPIREGDCLKNVDSQYVLDRGETERRRREMLPELFGE